MVDVTVRDDVVIFEPRGWSKVWTFRPPVVVPLSAIRAARRAPAGIGRGWWKGIRLPGTHVPGLIVAGRFYHAGAWEFWDVRGAGDRAIEVELEDAEYRRLVVDVADPAGEVARLQAVIAPGTI